MPIIDLPRLEAGLRAMGLLYGSAHDLHEVAAQAGDKAGAVRAYLLRGRPHLLSCYDVDHLVAMVLASCDEPAENASMIEQFHPR